MNDSTVDTLHSLLFGVRRSVRYHMRREAFFEAWHRIITSACSVIFGSAVIGSLLTDIDNQLALYAAGVVTILAALDLVIGTAQMARLHNDLRRRFLDLEKRLCGAGELDAPQLDALTRERLDIEADEPPVLRALDTICHNDLLRASGYPRESGTYVPLNWYQRCTAQLINWPIAR